MPDYAHRYRMRDDQGRSLFDHGGIWLLELGKFAAERSEAEDVDTELKRWLRFFTEGETLEEGDLPQWMQTEEMRQAMSTLKGFSEKERDYHAYQTRQNYLRQQRSIQRRLEELQATTEQALAEKEQERAEKDAALQRESAALAEIERLKRLLEAKPDA